MLFGAYDEISPYCMSGLLYPSLSYIQGSNLFSSTCYMVVYNSIIIQPTAHTCMELMLNEVEMRTGGVNADSSRKEKRDGLRGKARRGINE
jgi:hypothetical protein